MHKLSRRSLSAASSPRFRNSAVPLSSPLSHSGVENDNKVRWYSAVTTGSGNTANSAAYFNLRVGGRSCFGTRYESTSAALAELPAEKFEYQKEVLYKIGAVDEAVSAEISNRGRFLPSVLATGIFSQAANIERSMMAQTVGDASSQQIKRGGMVFLISPENPIITNLNAALPVDKSALGLVDLQYDAASLFNGLSLDNLALMGGMIFLLRHVYTGINEIMLDYVHNRNSRTFIMILLQGSGGGDISLKLHLK